MRGLFATRRPRRGSCRRLSLGLSFGGLLSLAPSSAWAEAMRAVEVDTRRVAVGQLLPGCRGAVCRVDLCPAPPPGGSRTIGRARVLEAVRQSGLSLTAASVAPLTRVKSAYIRWNPSELEKWAHSAVMAALPRGSELLRLEVSSAHTLPKRATLAARFGKAPRRSGRHVRSVSLQVQHEGVIVRRIVALAHLDVSPRAVQPTVRRGQSVELRIERPYAVVGAQAQALRDVWVGEVGTFKVLRTGKVLLGRVHSAGHVEVVQSR